MVTSVEMYAVLDRPLTMIYLGRMERENNSTVGFFHLLPFDPNVTSRW